MDQKMLIGFLFSACMEISKSKGGSTFHKRGRQKRREELNFVWL